MALVHFDAHVDTWPTNFGQDYAHGSVFYHAIREGLIDPRRMIQIGIRSPVQRDVWDWTIAQGVTILSALDVHAMGPREVANRVRQVIGRRAKLLSFDIDAVCWIRRFAPGTRNTGDWRTQRLHGGHRRSCAGLPPGTRFVGMDVVEVAPQLTITLKSPAALAAATVWEYLAVD